MRALSGCARSLVPLASVSTGEPCSCQNSVPDRPRKNLGQLLVAAQRFITPPWRPLMSSM